MDWPEIVADLERRVSEAEERTERLRRMLQDARELQADYPAGPSASNGSKPRPPRLRPPRRRRGRTIKQGMVEAMREAQNVGEEGLAPIEIRQRMAEKGQVVNRKSISAQLTHMKAAGEVEHLESGKWRLTLKGAA